MSCHLFFVLLFVILFVGNWAQRALRKEADRGEQYHNDEDGDRVAEVAREHGWHPPKSLNIRYFVVN